MRLQFPRSEHSRISGIAHLWAKHYTTTSRRKSRSFIHVSRTKGVPSTSINLKEALCEKIPLHHDLLRQFQQQHGKTIISQITVGDVYRGLDGVSTLIRETSEVDSQSGLKFRGLTIPEIIGLLPRRGNSPSPEALFWLLVTGDVPTHEQTESLIADWVERREKRKEWWTDAKGAGGIVGNIVHALPDSVSPLGRLSIALTAIDADRHVKQAINSGAMTHTYWEHIYEDSMELLATLPALVALVASPRNSKRIFISNANDDWVDFLLNCLRGSTEKLTEGVGESLRDFLRLYIAINGDDDGGIPGAHVAQILGTCQFSVNQALAAAVLAYTNEPTSGTMFECMDFQCRLQNALGRHPKDEALTRFLGSLVEKRIKITGHRISKIHDSRYKALTEFVKDWAPQDPDIKLSQEISNIVQFTSRTNKDGQIFPEMSAIAAPTFQYYGLKDMNFNQVLLCMSRALGTVASILWTTAVNAPVERPVAKPTFSYMNTLHGAGFKGTKTSKSLK